jgi:DNA-binding NarL/FixJ family response regulator
MTATEEDPPNPLAQNLSARELQGLGGLTRGLSNKEIARELELQEVTIKLHVKTLCRKLEAKNRTHAAMIAKDANLF